MCNRKSIITSLCFCLFFFWTAGQNNGFQQNLAKLIPASAEASAIATYLNYPVDFKTGVPQIEVPLFEVKTPFLTLPFTLTYHPSGLKNGQLNGAVGLGWTLNPLLAISRSINGLPDDESDSLIGYVDNLKLGNNTDCSYLLSLAKGIVDGQPDDFYYSIFGKNGRFFYTRSKYSEFSTLPFEPIVINRLENGFFVITDVDGTQYKFGKYSSGTKTAVEKNKQTRYSDSSYLPSSFTAWKVTEIVSKNKVDTIKFFYTSSSERSLKFYNKQYRLTEPINEPIGQIKPTLVKSFFDAPDHKPGWRDMYFEGGHWCNSPACFDILNELPLCDLTDTSCYYGGAISKAEQFYPIDFNLIQEHIVTPLLQTEIQFRNGKITYALEDEKILEISYFSKINDDYKLIKSVKFYQRNLRNENEEYRRFFLDSLDIRDNAGQLVQRYRFQYQDGYLPSFISNNNNDPWGYPGFMTEQVPTMNYIVENYYNKDNYGPSQLHLTLGGNTYSENTERIDLPILTKILYPTGGNTIFEFERNKFNNPYLPKVHYVGARIKKIIFNEGNGKTAYVRSYTYGDKIEGDGFGRVAYFPSRADFVRQQKVNTINPRDLNNKVQLVTTFTSTPTTNIFFDEGAPVMYPYVTEYLGTPEKNTGKTEYVYNIRGVPPRSPYRILSANYKDGWQNNELQQINSYKISNTGTYSLVSSKTFEYKNIYKDTLYTETAYQTYFSQNPDSYEERDICSQMYDRIRYENYNTLTGVKKLMKETETVFSSASPSSSSTTVKNICYENPKHLFVTCETITNSKSETITTTYKYPHDFSTGIYPSMVAKNILNPIIEQATTLTKGGTTSSLNRTRSNYINPFGSIYVPGSVEMQVGANPIETRQLFNKYDDKGNLLEQQKANDVKESYIWGYNYQYPVAKIIGKSYSEVTSQVSLDNNIINGTNTDDVAMRNELNKLRTLSGAFVTTYTYKPLVGMTSETDPNNRTIFYDYDALNRLSIVRDNESKILKKYCYNYEGQQTSCLTDFTAKWVSTGNYKCEESAGAYNGNRLREERDSNPYSPTYNQTKWIFHEYNTTSCPLPPPTCDSYACENYGLAYRCINGVCEQGYRINDGSYYDGYYYYCYYHYEWSDGQWSDSYGEYNYSPCQ